MQLNKINALGMLISRAFFIVNFNAILMQRQLFLVNLS